ncbi:DUF1007 family protein [Jannaschia sp. CCS1]|uniref:DUF1007 family protein n=1 Tax=Jannaschia sp. (strain CCS1) TaxID=290400 RepID=UPI00006C001C|nr:DUF1007 family protein [Jannaschia sp. CCS1]ABD54845.1 hypothetical protein Jann_1928 [Jannaschia sp. CCS1]
MSLPAPAPRLAVPALAALCIGLWPSAPAAHPHIFVDAGLRLVMVGGTVTAVEVTWLYDELYTLILLEDYGLDPDFDLVLTEAEIAATLGFDLNWSHGFEGGLIMHRGDAELELGDPSPVSLELVGEGQIRTTHRRAVIDPGGAEALVAQVYDPEFYVAFEMIGEMVVEGAPCTPELIRADLDAAYAGLEAALDAIGGVIAAEDNFPRVGGLFADRVVFECAG